MDIIRESYKKVLDEDAVMGAGDAAPAGDVSAPAATVDNSIVSGPGISRDDVLGKYEPGKGVFGKGDFNIPKNILGGKKGGVIDRLGNPSKKLKGHKNPYLKGMHIMNEDVDMAVEALSQVMSTNEAEQLSEADIMAGLNKLRNQMRDPSDIDAFIAAHAAEIERFENDSRLNQEQRNVFAKAWDMVKYAAAKGFAFIRKHWKKILIVILIIAAMLWFGQTDQGVVLGTKLFGKGYQHGVEVAKDAVKRIVSTAAPKAVDVTSVLDVLKKAKSWIPADPSLVPTGSRVDVAIDAAGKIFQVTLKDGTNGYAFEGDDTIYIPQF